MGRMLKWVTRQPVWNFRLYKDVASSSVCSATFNGLRLACGRFRGLKAHIAAFRWGEHGFQFMDRRLSITMTGLAAPEEIHNF